jgi:hypothetical protein
LNLTKRKDESLHTTFIYISLQNFVPMSSLQKKNTGRNPQQVSFNKRVQVRLTLSVNDMSEEEIESTWCQKKDSLKIRRREQKLHALLAIASNEETDNLISIYGVHTAEYRKLRSQRIRAYLLLILAEQERQWEIERSPSTCDADHLGIFSRRVTIPSIYDAKKKADLIASEVFDQAAKYQEGIIKQQGAADETTESSSSAARRRKAAATRTRRPSCHRPVRRPLRRRASPSSIMVHDLDNIPSEDDC